MLRAESLPSCPSLALLSLCLRFWCFCPPLLWFWGHLEAQHSIIGMFNSHLILRQSGFPWCEPVVWGVINSRLKQIIWGLLPWQWWAWCDLWSSFSVSLGLFLIHVPLYPFKSCAGSFLDRGLINTGNSNQDVSLFSRSAKKVWCYWVRFLPM